MQMGAQSALIRQSVFFLLTIFFSLPLFPLAQIVTRYLILVGLVTLNIALDAFRPIIVAGFWDHQVHIPGWWVVF